MASNPVVLGVDGTPGELERHAWLLEAVQPPLAELLSVDREYRRRASRDELPRITPRRFNPAQQAWLPVLHTTRGTRHYSALFSNTARAHEFGRTHDWVVIFVGSGRQERQCTVITGRRGTLAGKRVVRGREFECARYYGERDRTRRPLPASA